MKLHVLIPAALALMVTASCGTEKKAEAAEELKTEKAEPAVEEKKAEPKHWSYDGESSPEHWAEIEKESACGGNHQSPIDIVTGGMESKASGLTAADLHYDATTTIHDVTNNGHSLQYNFDDSDNYVDYEGKRYDLAQFHFHAASEHTIDGMHFPLVIHMVHVSEDKEFVVLAVMVKEGESNDSFDFLETYLPVNPGETKPVGEPHTFAKYINGDFAHYNYTGSLTTPPCTEGVNWFIFKDALSASPEQVKMIADLMPRNNFRPTQPLNDRVVYLSE